MSEENDDSSGDDLSGLSGFFFYMFIVHPATAWILRPGRFERKKSIMYAIAFLAALAAIKTGKFTALRRASSPATLPLNAASGCNGAMRGRGPTFPIWRRHTRSCLFFLDPLVHSTCIPNVRNPDICWQWRSVCSFTAAFLRFQCGTVRCSCTIYPLTIASIPFLFDTLLQVSKCNSVGPVITPCWE